MSTRFCTVHEASLESARDAGARELDVPPEDVEAEELASGEYRVTVVRARSSITVNVSFDNLEATIALMTPPIGDAPLPTRDDLVVAMAAAGVTQGVLLGEIDALVADMAAEPVEKRNVVVARGRRPVPGEDGKVVRHYLQPTEAEPERRRRIVREGELLIEQDDSKPGTPGFTVVGQTMPAPQGAQEEVTTGSGISVSAGQNRWTAAAPGFGYLEFGPNDLPTVVPAVTIGEDHMHAFIDLRTPTADEEPLQRGELDAALAAAGVAHGLLPKRLDAAWAAHLERGDLPRPIRIADGTPPQRGRDAGIDFEFDLAQGVGNLSEESGRIDFRERGTVNNVREGQLLGTWRPAGPGEPGQGVDGTVLPADPGTEGTLTAGENVETEEQEDGSVLIAAVMDGMAVLKPGDVLHVVEVMLIPGDVDFSVGNIDATGSILVKGTIRAGFRVTAKHDITVQESIEEAIVEAGGEVLVRHGIIGGDDARVHGELGVTANFAQHAYITSGGDVVIRDSDSNSVIECAGQLLAADGHGRLMGGRYLAGRGLVARVLGSDFGAPTLVAVGDDPLKARELRDVRERLTDVEAQLEKIASVLEQAGLRHPGTALTPDQAAAAEKLREQQGLLQDEANALTAQGEELDAKVQEGAAPMVDVKDTCYYGVEIYIRGFRLRTQDALQATRFVLDPKKREVRAVGL